MGEWASFVLAPFWKPLRGPTPPDVTAAIANRTAQSIRRVPRPSLSEGWETVRFFLLLACPSAIVVASSRHHRSRVTEDHANRSFSTRRVDPERSRRAADTLPGIHPISNRHIPELESGLTHRKQRTGPLSNRHKFAFCNFTSSRLSAQSGPASSSLAPASKLLDFELTLRKSSTSLFLIDNFGALIVRRPPQQLAAKADCPPSLKPPAARILIENDMHSRKQSSHCKQMTYEFLIANVFHCARSSFQPFTGHCPLATGHCLLPASASKSGIINAEETN